MRTHGWAGSVPGDDAEAVQRIVEAAGELIEDGHSVNINRLARHVGVTRPTLYRYFPDSDAVLRAVAAAATADLLSGLSRALGGISDPVEAVVEGIAASFELLRANKRFALLFDPTGLSSTLQDVTSDVAITSGRAIIDNLGIDWRESGWADADLDGLVEFMLRMLQSLLIDPGDHAQSGEELRTFLHRWVAPSVAIGSRPVSK
ncbi:TetR family transcriptional regulator [Gordonia amarae]|uniref:TetR family transcriptional regulator n=2 Tax=Gordonia amarae TaxID=36821 RepID=A0A857KIG3_9ACTN|nr:TetR/AcrR family transcriptional regulator [Gordonia amarae]MCS3877121.1 AcrR family transcriptional regulator [Gordonia amarae]QHN15917.1 TetR family transcriptional regulator [Gordonia amarae]QHN20485.1 TetR family transcriptional regulator [Gordonia amarae]QHN29337.1 TetR family transcriptional regulator [Gordonia amarae]QHN38116.1 TetR family transcriptional regulator [Gordonia amarae]